jgi:UDP-2,3-diacylglucosamine pyrophosphatase LpxH
VGHDQAGALARVAHAVLRKIMKISRGATEVIYIPGNHDANFREFCGSDFGNIQIRETVIHEPAGASACS